MLQTLSPFAPTGAPVQHSDTLAGLSAIHQAECAAVLCTPHVPDALLHWLSRLSPEALPNTRCVLPVQDVPAMISGLCGQLPAQPERQQLIQSLTDLAAAFADVMCARLLRFRLDLVTTNACRKFHQDVVPARLVCTYRGTGTQYGFGPRGTEPEEITTIPTGAPLLLRGSEWPEQPASGLLHRSPPIAGTGETRLVLVLDPLYEAEA